MQSDALFDDFDILVVIIPVACRGWEISQQRVGKIMDELGLVRRGPKYSLPPPPAVAATALFLGTHWRLGAESLVLLLDAPVLEQILDCYAHSYVQLEDVEEFGDTKPWSAGLIPVSPGLFDANASEEDAAQDTGDSNFGPSSQASLQSSQSLASAGRTRRRAVSRVQHLPTRAAGNFPPSLRGQHVSPGHAGGRIKLYERHDI